MAHVMEDRVLETSTTTGTGDFTLEGAVAGYRAFNAVLATSDTFRYYIEAVDPNGVPTGEYEFGLGTYNGSNVFVRTTVVGSSNANASVNFSAGTKRVGLGVAAPNSTLTRTEWKNALQAMTNPMTTAGDVIRGGTAGAPTRVGIGTTGQKLTVVGGQPTWDSVPSFSAWNSTATSLTSSTSVKVLFQTEEWDIGGNFASSTFTAPVNGVYLFQAAVALATNPANFILEFRVNGTLAKRHSSTSVGAWNGVVLLSLTAGQTVEIYVQQSAATQNTVNQQAFTYFQGHLIERT